MDCVWVGYDKTGALCIMFIDAFGDLWSLKFIHNSRKNIGEYYDQKLGMESMFARIRRHLQAIDRDYHRIHSLQVMNREDDATPSSTAPPSTYATYKLATHLTFCDLVLDRFSPWEATKIGMNPLTDEDVVADVFETSANIVRDYMLSPACSILYRVKQHLSRESPNTPDANERHIVEMAVVCAYTRLRFFVTTTLVKSTLPIYVETTRRWHCGNC